MAFVLVLTTSRGAWLGVLVTLLLAGIWWFAGKLSSDRRQLVVFVGLMGLGVVLGCVLLALFSSLRVVVTQSPAVADRLQIAEEAILLVRDYPFTGLGFGGFPLVHSTYSLIIFVPILEHAHSLPLDVALNQGVLGVLTVVCIVGRAAWLGLEALDNAQELPLMLVPGLFALVATTVHDLFDDPLYATVGMPLLWIPVGMIVSCWCSMTVEPTVAPGRKVNLWLMVSIVVIVGFSLLSVLWRPLRALWYANLGAVHQTRIELSCYDYESFDDPSLDQIRQQVDLAVAERYFEQAIALNPNQVTARTRLAAIALSRAQYDQALMHAQAAWDGGHRDRVTRLIMSDALVATGHVDRGVDLVRELSWAEARLDGQGWYRYWLSKDYRRAADAWRAVLELNPENARVRAQMETSEALAEGS
jgi:tetratricopeptide (TPR) repeat protein